MRDHLHRIRPRDGLRSQSLQRTDLDRWMLLGGIGMSLAALALSPLARAQDLLDINGQPRWMATLEIPFDGPAGVDTPRLHVALENHRGLENGRHIASVGYQWVLGDRVQDRRQTGFYSGNEFAYIQTDTRLETDPSLFYRGEKLVFNELTYAQYSQLSNGAKGALALGALVGIVLAVSNGTSSDGPSSPEPDPEPQPEPGPTPASAAAGVIGEALSPSSIAGFFNTVLGNSAGSGTTP